MPAAETIDGVRVIRVKSAAYDRSRLSLRAINYGTYVFQTLRVALMGSRPDVVMCMTDPPVIGDVALIVARRFRAALRDGPHPRRHGLIRQEAPGPGRR